MLHIVLYQPQIPPNTGNIARLCVATGATLHLIKPLGFSLDDSTLKRAGLDYWQHLSWKVYENWDHFLLQQPTARLHFFSKKAKTPYTKKAYQKEDYLVFGSETQGLPEAMMRQYEKDLATIPMWGPTRSLNLATSVGIVCYEALRQITGAFEQWPHLPE